MDNTNNQTPNEQEQSTFTQEDFQKQEQPLYQQQPYYQSLYDQEEPVSFGDWMLTLLIMAIPCVNIIMAFVWAFGNTPKRSKSNFFKAYLAWILITIIVIAIFIFVETSSINQGINVMEHYL